MTRFHSLLCLSSAHIYEYTYMCVQFIYITSFIYSSISGCLVYFQILAITNNASVNTGWIYHFELVFDFLYPEVDSMVGSSIFNFLRNLHTLLHIGYTNLHSHQQWSKRFPFLHILDHTYLFFGDRHSNKSEILSHCDFGLHFIDN